MVEMPDFERDSDSMIRQIHALEEEWTGGKSQRSGFYERFIRVAGKIEDQWP